jgi:hypothetical protein
MKPEEQRIAIAESCGWTDLRWIGAAGEKELYGKPAVRPGGICVPDYLADLNAMLEAEKTLDEPQSNEYIAFLYYGDRHEHAWDQTAAFEAATSTAAERAEAFLRTINKWEETTQ